MMYPSSESQTGFLTSDTGINLGNFRIHCIVCLVQCNQRRNLGRGGEGLFYCNSTLNINLNNAYNYKKIKVNVQD